MSLTKSNLIVIVSCACVMLVLSSVIFFPKVVDNLITGFASISSFSVSVAVGQASNGTNESNATTVPKKEPEKEKIITFFSYRTKPRGTAVQTSFAEEDFLEINTSASGVFEDYLTLHNYESVKKEFIINFTNSFIHDLVQNITLGPNESVRIPIPIDTRALRPGEYTDYIFIKSGEQEENVSVSLKLMAGETPVIENKTPEKEQPTPAVEQIIEQSHGKKPAFLSIVLVFIGVLLVAGMIFLFLHLRRGMKAIGSDK